MLKHIFTRRSILKKTLNQLQQATNLDESCLLSYCHPNLLASFFAWKRLFDAKLILKKFRNDYYSVLDFGSGSGELGVLLGNNIQYDFVEENDALSEFNLSINKGSRRIFIDNLPQMEYDVIFCLDSLEHNEDFQFIIKRLFSSLKHDGVLILSGPTENFLYKIGRKIAGFDGSYHTTNIHSIENFFESVSSCLLRFNSPYALPFFSISIWSR